MFVCNVTPLARREFENHFKSNELKPIRIVKRKANCRGPRLGVMLDAATKDDYTISVGTLIFCIEKQLLEEVGETVFVDMNSQGMYVFPKKPFPVVNEECVACGECHFG